MKIRMLETRRGSPDCRLVYLYPKGLKADVPPSLGCAMIQNGWAESLEPVEDMESIVNNLIGQGRAV